MKHLCICEICSCGRHRCPHQITSLYKKDDRLDAMSEYTEKYPAYEGKPSRRPLLKPDLSYHPPDARFGNPTTFQDEYYPKKVSARKCFRPQNQLKTSGAPFNGLTTYTEKYPVYKGCQPPKSLKPEYKYKGLSDKMESITTVKADYIMHAVGPPPTRRKIPYQPAAGKMDQDTTYKLEYKPYCQKPVAPLRPKQMRHIGIGKIDTVSTYKDNYRQWEHSRRGLLKPDLALEISKQPFQDFTTYRHYHQGLAGPMARSCKPEHVKVGSEAPLQSNTEFRDQYKMWPVTLPPTRKVKQYKYPTEKMDLNTTMFSAYITHKIDPAKPIRPVSNITLSSDALQDETTMRTSYTPWSTERRTPIIKPDEIPKPTGKIQDLTTFRDHFVEKPLQPVISFKPILVPLKTEALLDRDTTYRTEYTPKELTLCPARFESPPGFVFLGLNERGHRMFRKLGSPEKVVGDFGDMVPTAVPVSISEHEKKTPECVETY